MTPNRTPSPVIVPWYNEEEVLPETDLRTHHLVRRLILASKINQDSHIRFVDDGSKDRTWSTPERIDGRSFRRGPDSLRLTRTCRMISKPFQR
jgi:Glycosyl transferase family 2